MSNIVSNFIGGISPLQFGSTKVTPDFDLNDSTFADLLKKQMETKLETAEVSMLSGLGMPSGINIESFDFSELIEPVQTENNIETNDKNSLTSSETVTFFNSLLDNINETNDKAQLFNFAKKQASNLYRQYSRSVVTDVNEFVEDINKVSAKTGNNAI